MRLAICRRRCVQTPLPCFVLQRAMKQLEEKNGHLEDMVQRLQFDNKAKEQILSDTREILG